LALSETPTKDVRIKERISALAAIEGRFDSEANALRTEIHADVLAMPRGADDRLRADLLIVLARQLDQAGRYLDALYPAALAVDLLKQADGESEVTARALLLQGSVLVRLFSYGDAASCFIEAEDMAERIALPLVRAMAMANRGNVFVELGRVQRGIELFRSSLELAQSVKTPVDEQSSAMRQSVAAGNIGYSYRLLGHKQDALNYYQEASKILPKPFDRLSAAHLAGVHASIGELLVLLGRSGEADHHGALALDNAQLSNTLRARLRAEAAAGLHDVANGRTRRGMERIERVVNTARSVPTALRGALLTMVEACQITGQTAAALAHMREYQMEARRAYRVAETQRRPSDAGHRLDVADAAFEQTLTEQDRHFASALRQMLSDEAALIGLALAAEAAVDPDGLHIFRVAGLAGLLGEAVGLPTNALTDLRMAAALHDIGMIGVPEPVQVTPRLWGELDELERNAIITHPSEGVALIARRRLGTDPEIFEAVLRHHHERHDGRGYPNGLAGEAIPLVARIVAVCDSFDVMTHGRPYAPARSVSEALTELTTNAGGQFDPALVAVLTRIVQEMGSNIAEITARAIAWTEAVPSAHAARLSMERRRRTTARSSPA
jgi:HD-GYP domain-containing protein (c-di-GMP phosphodiesterase class II)